MSGVASIVALGYAGWEDLIYKHATESGLNEYCC